MGFRQTVTVRRRAGAYTMGQWSDTTSQMIKVCASVQPASAREMEALDEGRRNRAAYTLFTSSVLQVADAIKGCNSDIVILDNEEFEVVGVNKRQNKVLPHYQYLVSKATQ